MRLDGSLEDFGLPDVLQLLSQTRKSGALHLAAADEERKGVIRLGEGAINAACSDLRRQVLARRLVGAGLVSDDALVSAAEDVRGGAASLLRALLDHSDLSHDAVTQLAADQATDAVCELLRWNAGTFSFMVGEPDPDGLILGLSAEDLVAEGHRRMQVWPNLTSLIPSPESVLRLAPSPSFDPSCTREEWGLLALVDGNRSVSEIVALLGRSEFAVAGALAALETHGGVSIPEAPAEPVVETAPAAAPADEVADVPIDISADSAAPGGEVPQAREAAESEPVGTAVDSAVDHAVPQQHAPITQGAYDRPLTNGSAALDTAPAVTDPVSAEPARGLDSAVTKSLVLRLIAGVRGL
jgi:hypothetical protein